MDVILSVTTVTRVRVRSSCHSCLNNRQFVTTAPRVGTHTTTSIFIRVNPNVKIDSNKNPFFFRFVKTLVRESHLSQLKSTTQKDES